MKKGLRIIAKSILILVIVRSDASVIVQDLYETGSTLDLNKTWTRIVCSVGDGFQI